MMNNNFELPVSRRRLMQFGAGFIGTATLASAIGLDLKNPQPAAAKTTLTPDQALEELMAGNQRFIEDKSINKDRSLERLKSISEKQAPFASIVGCADSRSSLEVLFDQGFGDIFVVREAGNIATPEQIGSLEYSALVLGSKVIMVMGHYACGAVKATLAGEPVPGSIPSVLAHIKPAVEDYLGQQDDKEAMKKAAEANVIYQMNKIKRSPVLAELVTANQLKIVGAYFDFTTGVVTVIA